MKFYATVKNERGGKEGMGSNEALEFEIMIGNKRFAEGTLEHAEVDGKKGYSFYFSTTVQSEDDRLSGDSVDQAIEFYITEDDLKGKKHDPRTCENSVPCLECMEVEGPQEFKRQVAIMTKGKKPKGERYCTSCGNAEAQSGKHCSHCGKKLVYKI